MALPTITKPKYMTGAGALMYAPIGTAEPSPTVVASVLSDAWPGGWLFAGMTDAGVTKNIQTTFNPVEFAESLDPQAWVSEARQISIAAALGNIVATALKLALNGGTLTSTGSGTTKLTTYDPPDIGQEVRIMLGWESTDSQERWVWRQCIQTGNVSTNNTKGAAGRALIPVEFNVELPDTGLKPFQVQYAGPRA